MRRSDALALAAVVLVTPHLSRRYANFLCTVCLVAAVILEVVA